MTQYASETNACVRCQNALKSTAAANQIRPVNNYQDLIPMFKRVALFLVTNLAVVLVLSVVLRLLGVDRILDESGSGHQLPALLVLSLVIGFGGSLISLAMSKWMAKRSTGARVITQPQNAIEILAASDGGAAGQAGGYRDAGGGDLRFAADLNAFATGARRNSALVAVSTGLLHGMEKQDEVEAVLAHEVSHVANGDMVTLALVQGVVNTFVIFLSRDHRSHRRPRRAQERPRLRHRLLHVVIVAQLVLGVLASIIVMWVSRQREFRADAGSARLNGRQPMIDALTRLDRGGPAAQLPEVPAGVRHIGIAAAAASAAVHEPPAHRGAHRRAGECQLLSTAAVSGAVVVGIHSAVGQRLPRAARIVVN